jgi:hypothetical protein
MRFKRQLQSLITTMVALILAGVSAHAQSAPTVFTVGLKAPTKIISAAQGSLVVTEGGNGPNTGRVSVIDRTGQRRTLIDNLPSAITQLGEAGPSGPSGLDLSGRTLFVLIGGGNSTVSGPAPGSEAPNPNPASPIFSSLLALHCSHRIETMTGGFALNMADQMTLKNGGEVALTNTHGERLVVELIVDFPDYVAEPRPDFPGNVRSANPFGVVATENLLYVVDASLNKLFKVDANNGAVDTLASFAPSQNPLPFGPPVVDSVPDSVRLSGDQLLVTNLTGFPFPPGVARVRKVNLDTGAMETFIDNLTSAIDVLPFRNPRGTQRTLVLEFSTNMSANPAPPGRLRLFDAPGNSGVVITGGLISPTGVARDQKSGDLFVTEIFTGRVMRIAHARVFVRQHFLDFLNREPDTDGWDFWSNQFAACGTNQMCTDQKMVEVSQEFFYSSEFISGNPDLAANLRGTSRYNEAFVRECYRRYLQREGDAGGLAFWTGKLNERIPNVRDQDYSEIIRAFITSPEYRSRFGLAT